jgi:hypothetical protein
MGGPEHLEIAYPAPRGETPDAVPEIRDNIGRNSGGSSQFAVVALLA